MKFKLTIPIALIISLIWIILARLLAGTVGVKHGPSGGIDSIAAALIYVFMWKMVIIVPPVILMLVSFGKWLYDHNKKAFLIVATPLAIAIVAVACGLATRMIVHSASSSSFSRKRALEPYVGLYTQNYTYEGSDYIEDYYYTDNDLNFKFHVKDCYDRDHGHMIYVHFWNTYMEEAVDLMGDEFKEIVRNAFSDIADVEDVTFKVSTSPWHFNISIKGDRKENYSDEQFLVATQIASDQIIELIRKWDPLFDSRDKRAVTSAWYDSTEFLQFNYSGFCMCSTYYPDLKAVYDSYGNDEKYLERLKTEAPALYEKYTSKP